MCSSLWVNEAASEYEHVVNCLVGEASIDFGSIRALGLKMARKDRAVELSIEATLISNAACYNSESPATGATVGCQEYIGIVYHRCCSYAETASDGTLKHLAPNV